MLILYDYPVRTSMSSHPSVVLLLFGFLWS